MASQARPGLCTFLTCFPPAIIQISLFYLINHGPLTTVADIIVASFWNPRSGKFLMEVWGLLFNLSGELFVGVVKAVGCKPNAP